jgi:hypothetical protein
MDESDDLEQAVLVYLRLSNDEFGSAEDRAAAHALEDELTYAVESAGLGEFDGVEFGMGEVVFFIYGWDADKIFALIEPVLRNSPLARGGYAIKRYGGPDSAEIRVNL